MAISITIHKAFYSNDLVNKLLIAKNLWLKEHRCYICESV